MEARQGRGPTSLGLEPEATVARYLVLSGGTDRGRSHHCVGVFDTLDEACQEVARLRSRPAVAWAEVTAVDVTGRLSLVYRDGPVGPGPARAVPISLSA